MLVMFIMVIRTDRKTRTNGQTGQTDLTFKLDFPGNLCRAAFAILAMFHCCSLKVVSGKWIERQSSYYKQTEYRRKLSTFYSGVRNYTKFNIRRSVTFDGLTHTLFFFLRFHYSRRSILPPTFFYV